MKIAAVCVTYKNPIQLGWMIQCFLEQDYEGPRELVILDDAGQYPAELSGDRWTLVSSRRRFRTLGEKRNAAIGLISPDTEGICVWDDDDIYLPWALTACAASLEKAPWSRPSQVLHEDRGRRLQLRRHLTGGFYHGGWAYTRDAWGKARGYPCKNNGEDLAFRDRMKAAGVREVDPIRLGFDPFYIYRWGPGSFHLSGMGLHGYEKLTSYPMQPVKTLQVEWPVDYRKAIIQPEVHPRPF